MSDHTFTLKTSDGLRKAILFAAGNVFGLSLLAGDGSHIGKSKSLTVREADKLVSDFNNAKPAFKNAVIWAALGYDGLRKQYGKPLATTITHPGLFRGF